MILICVRSQDRLEQELKELRESEEARETQSAVVPSEEGRGAIAHQLAHGRWVGSEQR
jgi:LDH2 family malate/lactate/ureidoglycolate dehydrogenase